MPDSTAIRTAAALVPHALLLLRQAERVPAAERRRMILDAALSAKAHYGPRVVQIAFEVAQVRHRRALARAVYAAQIRAFLDGAP